MDPVLAIDAALTGFEDRRGVGPFGETMFVGGGVGEEARGFVCNGATGDGECLLKGAAG